MGYSVSGDPVIQLGAMCLHISVTIAYLGIVSDYSYALHMEGNQ